MAGRPRIAVVGAGPAGLSAAAHLLEQARGQLDLELYTQGHHLGGKAKSWKDEAGYTIDHGFHAVFGFYDEMRALARRAGVDLATALVPSRGRTRFFHPDEQEVHLLKASRNPLVQLWRSSRVPWLSSTERRQLSSAVVRLAQTAARVGTIEAFDDVCYRALLIEHGAPPRYLSHPYYRQVQELLFNAPYEVSGYIVLRAARLLGHCYDDAVFHFVAGGMTELFWEPITRYVTSMGAQLRLWNKVIGLSHDGSRLTGLRFGIPDNERFHDHGKKEWPTAIPTTEGVEWEESGHHAVICTLPQACFSELNPTDAALWGEPFFANIRKLRSVPTLSLQLWLTEPGPQVLDTTLSGLPLPLGYAVDLKQVVPAYRADARYGSLIEWVGTETGYESLTDAQLVERTRAELSRVPGCAAVAQAPAVHQALRRNRDNYARYLLTEPGTLRLRPTVETPLKGLFLAGDWVRNEIDLPTMEGAIRSGIAAAQAVLKTL